MEVEGKTPTGLGPGARSAIGIMLADRMRRPTSASERRQLSTAVSDHGWSLSVRFGMGTALAELCVVDQEEAAREAWGLPCRIELILLVAVGVAGPELEELVRVVRTSAPRTRIYRWTGTDIMPFDRPGVPSPAARTPRSGAVGSDPENLLPEGGPEPESNIMLPPAESGDAGRADAFDTTESAPAILRGAATRTATMTTHIARREAGGTEGRAR